MQLMHPCYNTAKLAKRKPSANLIKKRIEHEQWLRKNGAHPDQLIGAKNHRNKNPTYKTENISLSNQIVDGGRASGIMANLHREPAHIRTAIMMKAARTAPLYNKGGIGYITDGTDMKTIGSLSRRGSL